MTEAVSSNGRVGDAPLGRASVPALRELAIGALKRMYRREEGLFAFRLQRRGEEIVQEGVSRRYSAIVLLGLAGESPEVEERILGGESAASLCDRLIDDADRTGDLGEVALTLWAARQTGHLRAKQVLERLRSMEPDRGAYPTVEVSWSLTALVAAGDEVADRGLADRIADRLLKAFRPDATLFPHWPEPSSRGWRGHLSCFTDKVYPIQALSHYHRATGREDALVAAKRCAIRMCELQGPEGQWWWHFDARTGRVVERFPVYSVHQDSMAPMALFALEEACGEAHHDSIRRGLTWLGSAPELGGGSLVDIESDVIWRKVARREPGKMARGIQATASRVHPGLRVPGMDILFSPGRIDAESRPYHMGWILYAFPVSRAGDFR